MSRLLVVFAILSVLVSVQAWGAPSSASSRVSIRQDVTMKIFDWKARDAFVDYTIPAGTCRPLLCTHPLLSFSFSPRTVPNSTPSSFSPFFIHLHRQTMYCPLPQSDPFLVPGRSPDVLAEEPRRVRAVVAARACAVRIRERVALFAPGSREGKSPCIAVCPNT